MEDLGYNPIGIDDDEEDFYYDDEDEVFLGEELTETAQKVEVEASEAEEVPEGVTESQGVTFDDDEDVDSKASGGNDNDILTMEEKMRYFADRVISAIVGGKSINKYAIGRLISSTSPKLFRDENFVIFSIIYSYKDRIKSINIDADFVYLFLDNNRKLIEKSTSYLDIYSYGEVDGSATLAYIAGVVKHFKRLCSMPDMSQAEFDLLFEKYIVVFKAVEAQKVFARSNQILTEGMKISGKTLIGFDDSYNYSRRQLAEIEGLVDMNQGSGFISMREVLESTRSETMKPTKIADFDKLEALNEVYGGVYTSNFYQVLAPSKGGKSKFCARVCHTAIVKYGTNVTVWPHEGGVEAWTAQMRAIHFDYSYNEGAGVADKKYGINQDVILFDKYPSAELKELEMVSKSDLGTNPEYGNVDYIDRPFEVETFIDEIDSSVKSNNSRLVIIDYLQLIDSKRLPERERIAKAYKDLLSYCKKNNIAVMSPGQYKQEVIDALANKSDTGDAEMRTAGGGSAEVIRTPDINFALWASTADLRNNRMKILSMPCRFNKPFPEIPCYVDLGICQFASLRM